MLISPVMPCKVRNDKYGSGYYKAKRGDRLHEGIDFECVEGQDVLMPITGVIERIARPYAGEDYSGVLITSDMMDIKLFYLMPRLEIIGKVVEAGETIGHAQNISKRYHQGMTPHIHMVIPSINPLLVMEGLKWNI